MWDESIPFSMFYTEEAFEQFNVLTAVTGLIISTSLLTGMLNNMFFHLFATNIFKRLTIRIGIIEEEI